MQPEKACDEENDDDDADDVKMFMVYSDRGIAISA